MVQIENKKGNDPLFKNGCGKICFPDKGSDYLGRFGKISIGDRLVDDFFRVIKELEKVDIIDINPNKLEENKVGLLTPLEKRTTYPIL